MIQQEDLKRVSQFAVDIRIQAIRQFAKRGFGHVGGSMSIADLLSVLYCLDLRYNPQNPRMENRDWLVCSKCHAGPAIYAALALKGFFPMEWLDTLNQPGTNLPSHCDRMKTPGVDVTTGSLGQGLSIAAGVAMAQQREERSSKTYCITGDGECQEGQIWEAVLFAAQQRLSNLIWRALLKSFPRFIGTFWKSTDMISSNCTMRSRRRKNMKEHPRPLSCIRSREKGALLRKESSTII